MHNSMAFRSMLYHKIIKKIFLNISKRNICHLKWQTRNLEKKTDLKYLTNHCYSNKFSTNFYNSDTEESSMENDSEVDEYSEIDIETVNIRNLLHANSNDPLILKLNECASIQEVLAFINSNESTMDVSHISQAVLVLWDLQKIFYRYNMYYNCPNNNSFDSYNVIKKFQTQVTCHSDFDKLMHLILNHFNNFSLNALTCMLLYLHRMGVEFENKVMQQIIKKCEDDMKRKFTEFPLTALSRFLVTVFSEEGIWPVLVSQNAIPIVIAKLETCNSVEEFKLLTICLNKLNAIVTTDILNKYKQIAQKLIDSGVINHENHRTIIKAIRFLSYPHWFETNLITIRNLMYLLRGHIHTLTSRELTLLFKVFQSQKEPADMLQEIQENVFKQLSSVQDESADVVLELLSCAVPFSSPLQRLEFEKILRTFVNKRLSLHSLNLIYQILYHVKSSDSELCNKFWDQYAEKILCDESENRVTNLINACHKYVHFNNDNRYRYFAFEKSVEGSVLRELEGGVAALIPTKFAKIASFFIACSNNPRHLQIITRKLQSIREQLNVFDCYNLAKGVQNAQVNKSTAPCLKVINELLDDQCRRQLTDRDVSVQHLNIILRNFSLRKASIDNLLYAKLVNDQCFNPNTFTSNIMKDLVFSLQINDCLIPGVMERIISAVLERGQSILGNTAIKVLYLCYHLGYSSHMQDDFLDLSVHLINRDKDRLSGLTYLQAALSLCFYHKLPEDLVKHIFSVSFLEKLDEELSYCYAKATYPMRVQDSLMQLNRAVCLDYPGSNIPWFHKKYVEGIHKQEIRRSYFHQQVSSTFSEIFGDDSRISRNYITPYGYQVDFRIDLDENMKIALNLLTPKAYSTYHTNLKGHLQLKQRHLEILGYRWATIEQSEWKSLCTQDNCIEYIKSKLSLEN